MLKFVHISDTHLVPPGHFLCALEPSDRLKVMVERINALHPDAAFVVHTGDLSYHGMEPAYVEMKRILGALQMPCHLMIGNHDDREAFKRVFPDTPCDEHGFVQYVVETPEGALLMMDTVEHGKEHGTLCEHRLAWLDKELSARQDQAVYLFLHHPPFDVGIKSLDSSQLSCADALHARLAAHGNVRHLFYGHVHRAIGGSWRGIPTSTVQGTNHQVGLYLGNEPHMIGTHEASAACICLIDEQNVVIHYQDLMDLSARFLLTHPDSKRAANAAELVPPPRSMLGRV